MAHDYQQSEYIEEDRLSERYLIQLGPRSAGHRAAMDQNGFGSDGAGFSIALTTSKNG
jgi:hypothetical protein